MLPNAAVPGIREIPYMMNGSAMAAFIEAVRSRTAKGYDMEASSAVLFAVMIGLLIVLMRRRRLHPKRQQISMFATAPSTSDTSSGTSARTSDELRAL